MSDVSFHDAYVHRLQAFFEPVLLRKLLADGTCVPWFTINPQDVLPELVIAPSTLRTQIDVVTLQIGWWSRLSSHTQRIVDVQERHLRTWQAQFELKIHVEAKEQNEKLPTQKHIESLYRTDPAYIALYTLIEEAQEAHNVVEGLCVAFKAKARLLEKDIFRASDGSLERWSP